MEVPNFETNPEQKQEDTPQKKNEDMSRRSFLKKGLTSLAGLVVASSVPDILLGNTEENMDRIEAEIDGQKMKIDQKDINRIERSAQNSIESCREHFVTKFDPEIQAAIIANLGEKLKAGLLMAQELGFQFNARDTFHAHLLIDLALWEKIKNNYPDMEKKSMTKEELIQLTKEIKALIFHCAEYPTEEEIRDKKFLTEKFPHRSIVVGEDGIAKNLKPSLSGPLQPHRLPNFGMLADDVNLVYKKKYADLAVNNKQIFEFSTDIEFIPTPEIEGGVKIDSRLPAFKFILSGYNK